MTSTFPRKTILCIDNDISVIDASVSKDEASRSLAPVIARVCSEDPCFGDLSQSGNPRPENMLGHHRPVQWELTGWMHLFRQVYGEASETEPSIFDQTLILTRLSGRNFLGGFKPPGDRSTG
jgi:hypothetical protein